MSGVQRCLVSTLVVTALSPGPALAAVPRPGTLVVSTHRGSAYAVVDLPRGVSFPREPRDGRDVFSWTGCGRFRGFYLQPIAANGDPDAVTWGAGLVDVSRFRHAPGARLPVRLGRYAVGSPGGSGKLRLPAGRYRLHVLGEGSCEVRVTVPEVRGTVRVTAIRATRAHYVDTELNLTSAAPGMPRAGVALLPFDVRAGTYVVAVTHLYYRSRALPDPSEPGTGSGVGVCVCSMLVADVPNPCQASGGDVDDRRHRGVSTRVIELEDGHHTVMEATEGYFPHGLVAGRYDGTHDAEGVTGSQHAAAAVLTFDS